MSNGIKSAFILTFGMVVSKAIGVFYRIPLANILGAEGIGLYQLVFSVYGLVVTIIGSGLPIAVSRLTAECVAKGKSSKEVLFPSCLLGLIIGLFFAVLIFFMQNILGKLQGNMQVSGGYLVIAPAIFFVSGLAVLKGYFQGKIYMFPTSISYIIEQIIKLLVGLTLAIYLAKYGVYYAFLGSLFGVTVAEFTAFITLFFIYLRHRENDKIQIDYKAQFIKIAKISLPITIGSMLIPLSQFFDSFIVINILESNNFSNATAMYGLYSGSVTPIVNMPIMLVLSLAMIIVPVVSKDRINCDYTSILLKSELSIKLCFLLGIPSSILLFIYAKPLLQLVYPNFSTLEISVSSNLLQIAVFSIVFYGTMQIETSLMQGLDKIYVPIKNLFIALLIKELCCITLVNLLGIEGLAIATVILSVVACLLNSISYHKILGANFNLLKSIILIVLSALVFLGVTLFAKYYIFNDILGFLVACTIGGSIYYILIRNNNLLSRAELKSLGVKTKEKGFLRGLNRSKYDYSSRCRKK